MVEKPPFHFHIVFYEPQIPPNTGNAGRVCVATQSTLHVINPGFSLSEKEVRRAGLDYWKFVDVIEHQSFDAFLEWRNHYMPDLPLFFIETGGSKDIYDLEIPPKAAFIFGKETTGIPQDILAKHKDHIVNVPMFSDKIRSLNLANTAALVLYEGIRQNYRRKSR